MDFFLYNQDPCIRCEDRLTDLPGEDACSDCLVLELYYSLQEVDTVEELLSA